MNNKKIVGDVVGVPNPKLTKTSQLINDSGFVYERNLVLLNVAMGKIPDIEEMAKNAYDLAYGANQAVTFENYKEFVDWFNENETLPNWYETYTNVGQNIMIGTLEVPDLWIAYIEDVNVPYVYVNDEKFLQDMENANGFLQVGKYKFGQLETQKVDLTEYPTKEEMNEAIKNGGGASYDLIQTITVGEDGVTTFTFDKDANGNSFKLNAVAIKIECPEVPNTSKFWRVCGNGSTSDTILFYFKPDNAGTEIVMSTERMCNGFWHGTRTRNNQNTLANSTMNAAGYINKAIDYVQSLYITLSEAPVGTVITVCGRSVG